MQKAIQKRVPNWPVCAEPRTDQWQSYPLLVGGGIHAESRTHAHSSVSASSGTGPGQPRAYGCLPARLVHAVGGGRSQTVHLRAQ
jgi:hypothetical protein